MDLDGNTGRRPCKGGGVYGAEAPTSQGAPRIADRTRSRERARTRSGRIVLRACKTPAPPPPPPQCQTSSSHDGERTNSSCFKPLPLWGLVIAAAGTHVGFQEADTEKGFLVQVTEGLLSKGSLRSRCTRAGVPAGLSLTSRESPGAQSVCSICLALAVGSPLNPRSACYGPQAAREEWGASSRGRWFSKKWRHFFGVRGVWVKLRG